MEFDEYQSKVAKTAVYPNVGENYTYPVLGLAGETGETAGAIAEVAVSTAQASINLMAQLLGLSKETGDVSEAIKKLHRDLGGVITDEKRDQVKKELGDILWYIASLAREFKITLDDVAESNIEKLFGRIERGTIHGSGDNR
jgi:NTP pyrophosphatase (non-canonical NTP hydrolase)